MSLTPTEDDLDATPTEGDLGCLETWFENHQTALEYFRACLEPSDAERAVLRELGGKMAKVGSSPRSIVERLAPDFLQKRPHRESMAKAWLLAHPAQQLRDIADLFSYFVPDRWHPGKPSATDFVRRLGLPLVYAGVRNARLPDGEVAYAIPPLGDLHDYQEQVAAQLRATLTSKSPNNRGVVFLPTGTGKTRVAVQTLLDLVPLSGDRTTVLWVADRGELCEQAVATFREVWQARGFERRPHRAPMLHVFRGWGGRPVAVHGDGPRVLVASIQQLASRAESKPEELAALSETVWAVVLDEAHHAVAPSYTDVLVALGLQTRHGGTGANASIPVIGLSATPKRGVDEEHRRLLGRFYGRLVEPSDGFRDHDDFVQAEFLARTTVVPVDTGYELRGGRDDIEHLARFKTLSQGVLNRAASDPSRTARIVRDLEARLHDHESALVFACSVEHSNQIAYVLRARGITAASVDGTTHEGQRGRTIERFRRKELKVLVNCNLLTTGFDAPGVDLVALARPVESEGLYAQMVGRGLRGPRNGGTPHCTVVNYEDRLGPFSDLQVLREWFRLAWA